MTSADGRTSSHSFNEHNSTRSATIGKSPNEVIKGFNPVTVDDVIASRAPTRDPALPQIRMEAHDAIAIVSMTLSLFYFLLPIILLSVLSSFFSLFSFLSFSSSLIFPFLSVSLFLHFSSRSFSFTLLHITSLPLKSRQRRVPVDMLFCLPAGAFRAEQHTQYTGPLRSSSSNTTSFLPAQPPY